MAARSVPKEEPPKRVIHLWVDPVYGVDTGTSSATSFNPACTPASNGCGPGECKPNDVLDQAGQGQNVLLHAPFPFETITGAIQYLPPLPYLSPKTGIRWEYAIIHLLPGRYAPGRGTQFMWSGVRNNGETFPINLPNHVSIQGTSALNTMIDLRSQAGVVGKGPAFQFGASTASSGVASFISHVTITGATFKDPENPNPPDAAAIYVAPNAASTPTILNCMIYGNDIGVLINAGPSPTAPTIHNVRLINNTIAWNRIGVWNGQFPYTGTATGHSNLMCINNIFDASPDPWLVVYYPFTPPQFPFVTPNPNLPNSDFEGLGFGDLNVLFPTNPPTAHDFNAYEAGMYNRSIAYGILGLPATQPSSTSTTAPGIDIAPITVTTSRRGVLYIRDLLWNGSWPGGPFGTVTSTPIFDASPHDFRLSPGAAPQYTTPIPPGAAANPPAPGGFLNPCVDQGLYLGTGANFPVAMFNGMHLSQPPGYLPLGASQATYEHSPWDFDCEGYGNPRVHDHSRYGTASDPFPVDLGADELGELIAAGYVFGTTSFFSWGANGAPSGAPLMAQNLVFYLGPPILVPAHTSRPYYHSPKNTFAIPGPQPAAYGSYPPWFDPNVWGFLPAGGYYEPYALAKLADVTPHLTPDLHPWWVSGGSACFPVWQTCPAVSPTYNPSLYGDPAAGIINPPGAALRAIVSTHKWLDGRGGSTWEFGTGLSDGADFGGPVTFAGFGGWCEAASFNPTKWKDTLLSTSDGGAPPNILSLRFTLEHKTNTTWQNGLAGSNIQTFLVRVE